MAGDRLVLEVEAALFSSGSPVGVDDLAETTGRSPADVRDALQDLREDYADRTTALEVAPAGEKWTMQVETGYAEQVRDLAPMEVPDKVLKTLALVAYHQPILQSDLQTMVGSKVYDHVRELSNLGLVRKRRHERTYELRTTDKFPEYFGLDTTDPEEIRRSLAEAVGLPEGVAREAGPEDHRGDPPQARLDEAVERDPDEAEAPDPDEAGPEDAGDPDGGEVDPEEDEAVEPGRGETGPDEAEPAEGEAPAEEPDEPGDASRDDAAPPEGGAGDDPVDAGDPAAEEGEPAEAAEPDDEPAPGEDGEESLEEADGPADAEADDGAARDEAVAAPE